ncbi:MAG: endonuclease [Bacteroidales bacterium]|jgi:endonuclease I|nr:endonuclease [Bacteroidales bacterium]
MKRFFVILFLSVCVFAQTVFAGAPEGYYNNANGKSGYALKTALHNIIKGHKVTSYNSDEACWTIYKDIDVKPGTIDEVYDMYSNCDYSYDNNQRCGKNPNGVTLNYKVECDCYNREHSMPKSWFNDKSPMNADFVHIVPTDGKINGNRSNFPFGEVGTASSTSSNGCKLGSAKSGLGYSGTVFEPADEYKGDFARIYFYMAIRYEDLVKGWSSDMLGNDNTQVFTTWAKNMLLKWHREDSVSDKERERNDGIQRHQNNRNPFVDYPELVEKIWGGDNTPFYLNGGSVGVEEPVVEEELSLSADTYPTAEIISVSGVKLKQVSFSEVNTTLDKMQRGVYIIRYLHKDGRNSVSRKVVI